MTARGERHEDVFPTNRPHLLGLSNAGLRLGSARASSRNLDPLAGRRGAPPAAGLALKGDDEAVPDHVRSARHQREQYVGPWLPEPLPDYVAAAIRERGLAAETVERFGLGFAPGANLIRLSQGLKSTSRAAAAKA